MSDAGVETERAVIGGTGPFLGAAGVARQTLLGFNAAELAAKAEEAKNSRLWAGIHYRIDNETGAAGGKLVGEMVLRASLG